MALPGKYKCKLGRDENGQSKEILVSKYGLWQSLNNSEQR